MTTELTALACTLLLTLVYVFSATIFRNRETGLAYNAGPRDAEGPPVGVVTARLKRAQANLYESLPLYMGAVLIAHLAGRHSALTVWGAWMFPTARAVYLPVYGLGVPGLRTLVYGVALAGILLLLIAALRPA